MNAANIQNLNLNINFQREHGGQHYSQEFDKEFSPGDFNMMNGVSGNVSVNLDSKNI